MKSHLIKYVIWLLLLTTITFNSISQSEDQLGTWNVAYVDWKINDQTFWYNEVQYRNHNLLSSFDLSSFRSAFGYSNKKGNLYGLIGVLSAVNKNDQEQLINTERRIYQELGIEFSLPFKSNIETRIRTEQRFFNENRFNIRYRLQTKVAHEISFSDKHTITPFLSSEIFLQNKNELFNQNRTAIGISTSIKNIDISLAKQWQFLPRDVERQQFVIKLGLRF